MIQIGIIGLGLMGGSLAKSFKKLDTVSKIVAFDTDKDALEKAKQEKVIDIYTDKIDDYFKDLDYIFICTPVNTIYEYATKLKDIVTEDCLITDIGSTKEKIVKEIDKMGLHYVGGHPMTGKESFGYDVSCDDLYKNHTYIIVKTKKTKRKDIEKLKKIILQIEANPIEIELEQHDFSVAAISHVPHVISAGLINMVKRLDNSEEIMKKIAAGGLKDITRISSSNPYMWKNICAQNKKQILLVLEEYQKELENFKKNIENEEAVFQYFESAKNYRDNLEKN